jgi:uncharacterized membrane protein required for colicin V production
LKELLSKLTWVDYIALVAVLRGLYVGYKSGIVQELLRIAAYIIALAVTLQFYEWAASQLTLNTFLNEATARVAAFVALLVGVYLVLALVRKVLIKMFKLSEGGPGGRLLGALLGSARLLVLLSFFFMLVDWTPLKELKTDVHERSLTGPSISRVAPLLYDFVLQLPAKLGVPAGGA